MKFGFFINKWIEQITHAYVFLKSDIRPHSKFIGNSTRILYLRGTGVILEKFAISHKQEILIFEKFTNISCESYRFDSVRLVFLHYKHTYEHMTVSYVSHVFGNLSIGKV